MSVISIQPLSLYGEDYQGHKPIVAKSAGSEQTPVYAPMPGPGKKVAIGNDSYIIYGFDKKPKLGTVIMKVEVFTKDGKKDTSLDVTADAGMPSMRGRP